MLFSTVDFCVSVFPIRNEFPISHSCRPAPGCWVTAVETETIAIKLLLRMERSVWMREHITKGLLVLSLIERGALHNIASGPTHKLYFFVTTPTGQSLSTDPRTDGVCVCVCVHSLQVYLYVYPIGYTMTSPLLSSSLVKKKGNQSHSQRNDMPWG